MERRELKGKDWRMKRDLIDDIRRIIVYLTQETMVFNGELEWKRKKEEKERNCKLKLKGEELGFKTPKFGSNGPKQDTCRHPGNF